MKEILQAHRHGDEDSTPLQMISSARLAYYMEMERQLRALFESLLNPPEVQDAVQPKT